MGDIPDAIGLTMLEEMTRRQIGWRWFAAASLFVAAFAGFLSGVSATARPELQTEGPLTMAYYSLGLFVVGGLDIGTPVGGPMLGRWLLWLAYFGSPLLTASAVIEALLRVLSPRTWQLRRLKNHIVIFGTGDLTVSYLRVYRSQFPGNPVLVVDSSVDPFRQQELEQTYGARVLVGDITKPFLLRQLRLHRARRIVMLSDDSFQVYEAGSQIVNLYPKLANRLVLHCDNLRFMRAMQDSELARQCVTFNSYNLAATGLVNDLLLPHLERTEARDVVVIAGFGRFGQTILEQLHDRAPQEVDRFALVDVDVDRRMLVVREQERLSEDRDVEIFRGDVSHPEVWRQLVAKTDLSIGEPVLILSTGQAANNVRTAVWLKQRYPNALVIARTNDVSSFALQLGAEHDITSISITQLVEDNIPMAWLDDRAA